MDQDGWGGWIRTNAWRNQKPLPYRLATPQYPEQGWKLPKLPAKDK